MKSPTYILTCEHGGNIIPEAYQYLFKGHKEVLYSHKAIDLGALHLAQYLAKKCALPLYYTTTSRLLVEANRSLDNENLFSEYSQNLSETEKQVVLDTYYFPHRRQVEAVIRKEIEKGNTVVHLAIHTFTPVMEGKVREVEIGILFDPDRALESTIARKLKNQLNKPNPVRKVMDNVPYPGIDDGFPTYLRQQFPADKYAGFELEINQKFFLNGERQVWKNILSELYTAIKVIA